MTETQQCPGVDVVHRLRVTWGWLEHMLLVLIPIAWTAIVVLVVAVCRSQ
jgi:hypothetical protein